MLKVTHAALDAMAELLDEENAGADCAIRLVFDAADGLSVKIDAVRGDDTLVRLGDRAVLALEPALAEALDGETLDVFEGDEGLQLLIK